VACIITLVVGTLFTIAMINTFDLQFLNLLAFGVAQISGFLLFLYLLTVLLFLKLTPRFKENKLKREANNIPGQILTKKNISRKIIAIYGLILVFINALPLLMTPASIINAENEFSDAYGPNWRNNIPADVESYFLSSQFNLYNYFMGFPEPDCNIDRDRQYHKISNDIFFNFDAYYPKSTNRDLPGNNSIIIKIHGGGWTAGDKSQWHTLWINKYLAAQGYIVFDIQYGLLNTGNIWNIPTPAHVMGNFTLHDMVEHIGIFTKQIANELAARYNANMDSVFIMGGSAGGHLTGVVGLGYNDPYFAGNFSTALTIKGIIPLYPANDISNIVSGHRVELIPGTPETNPLAYEKFTPSKLVDANDPPALFFQGLQDALTTTTHSKAIELALELVGVDGILLTFPLAAHANDYITSNNFAQVWLYYLERFLYLEQ
jgi:acetyl esterase/lipase